MEGSKEGPYLIPGFHGVREALTLGKGRIKELWIAGRRKSARADEILKIAGEMNIPVMFKNTSELSRLLPDTAHQGIVALVEKFTYTDLHQIVETSQETQGRALLMAADHITDEGNLGALIRTAAFFGAQGMIIPKDRSAGVTPVVVKRSSGALAHLPVARVVNLGRALDILGKKGFWIIGASGESPCSIYRFDWNRDLVVVMGNEERGLSRSVRQRCHQVVSIPAPGTVESLNVSVAGGIILAEICRQMKL